MPNNPSERSQYKHYLHKHACTFIPVKGERGVLNKGLSEVLILVLFYEEKYNLSKMKKRL